MTIAPPDPTLALRGLFGHEEFRPGQEEIVRAVLGGRSVFAIAPTGAGKSLAFQLPAMLLPGVTLVISPLIALMKDQLDGLPEGVRERATIINSALEPGEAQRRIEELLAGRYKLVYAAPERLRQRAFVHALRRADISLLTIDEAHCVSLWGDDFRPDFRYAARLVADLGDPAVLAMTATATPTMAVELGQLIGRPLEVVSTGVLRPNLHLSVERVADEEGKRRALLRLLESERGPTIVYVSSRARADDLARWLGREGIRAASYHAGLDPATRAAAQDAFMVDRVRVIVATIAFGMGVDKGNIRLIVHYNASRSLEAYAQEAGRAGRDRRPARCVLLFSASEKATINRRLADDRIDVEQVRAVYRALQRRLGQAPAAGPVGVKALAEEAIPLVDRGGPRPPGPEEPEEAEATPGDDTRTRVALAVLEEAGLVRWGPDLPTTFVLEAYGEPPAEAAAAARALGLRPDGLARRLPWGMVWRAVGGPLDALEDRLLSWADGGWVGARGQFRESLIEMTAPRADARGAVDRILAEGRQRAERRAAAMIDYAEARSCRAVYVAHYFGMSEVGHCDNCDACEGTAGQRRRDEAPQPVAVVADPAGTVRDCLAQLPFNVGKQGLIRILTGSAASPIKADRCRQFGAFAGWPKAHLERLIGALVEQGFLAQGSPEEYYVLRPTLKWGRETPDLRGFAAPAPAPPPRDATRPRAERRTAGDKRDLFGTALPAGDLDDEGQDRFERLRAWRVQQARALGMPPYVVFHDATLRAIAAVRPAMLEELGRIPGVGPAKLEKYGAKLLELLAGEAEVER